MRQPLDRGFHALGGRQQFTTQPLTLPPEPALQPWISQWRIQDRQGNVPEFDERGRQFPIAQMALTKIAAFLPST